jgi:hypothetical protein
MIPVSAHRRPVSYKAVYKAVVRPERIVVVAWVKFPNFLQSNCLA